MLKACFSIVNNLITTDCWTPRTTSWLAGHGWITVIMKRIFPRTLYDNQESLFSGGVAGPGPASQPDLLTNQPNPMSYGVDFVNIIEFSRGWAVRRTNKETIRKKRHTIDHDGTRDLGSRISSFMHHRGSWAYVINCITFGNCHKWVLCVWRSAGKPWTTIQAGESSGFLRDGE